MDSENESPSYSSSEGIDDSLRVPIECEDSPVTADDDDTVPQTSSGEVTDEGALHARAYQLEMFEESLKQNTIITMDTGSGKTQVAVLRIQHDLIRSQPGKIVWFLAPTVALCLQQLAVLKLQIPAAQIKMLSGNDNVDAWSDAATWDAFLKDTSVVVSTYQILFDALSHAFVRIDALSLIVFDEAHNCVGNHPGSKIMTIYREHKEAGLCMPAILGLTASPVMRSSPDALEVIEKTLHAVCKTPTRHRMELSSHVERPTMHCISCGPKITDSNPEIYTPSMKSLHEVLRRLDILKDPYIIRLRAENTERSRVELRKALEKESTYVFRQLRSLCRRSVEIRCELGQWASDYFIRMCITQYLDSFRKNDSGFVTWDIQEKAYLADILRHVDITPSSDELLVSKKVASLIEVLLSSGENTLGIVFVRETSTVAMLTHILSIHPLTKQRFRLASMCGTSNYAPRKRDIGELQREDDNVNLHNFRCGNLDLLVATDVLEEGIDVPACNLVVCFDKPSNLKSFIQRRGRARKRGSRLVLLDYEDSGQHLHWQDLEDNMKREYEDNLREIKEYDYLEELEESYIPPYYSQSTKAKLDMDQARSHLEHFCQVLASRPFVDWRPYFVTQKMEHARNQPPRIRATVVLPVCIPPDLRRVDSANAWYSERKACKDAAFQAYVALHKAGLVSDNLLPLKDKDFLPGVETRTAFNDVASLWNPWARVAHSWSNTLGKLFRRSLKVVNKHHEIMCEFDVELPVSIPDILEFVVYWDKTPWTIKLGEMMKTTGVEEHQTMALINLSLGHRFQMKEDDHHVVHFHSRSEAVTIDQRGSQQFVNDPALYSKDDFPYLVRVSDQRPHYFDGWLPSRPSLELVKKFDEFLDEEPTDVPWLVLRKWPRRTDFLHPILANSSNDLVRSGKPYQTIWPLHMCSFDSTIMRNVQFGSLIPSITHILEVNLVAHELSNTLLKTLAFTDTTLVLTAICSPGAQETTNYERFEFLGDSILKLLSTVSVAVNHPLFPEGYLSKLKDRIVSNSRLCRCAINIGLDRFIIDKPFTGNKWRPIYVNDLLQRDTVSGKRQMSTKVLADVVESIIGASFLDGGTEKAISCARLFLPEVQWHDLQNARSTLASRRTSSSQLPATLAPLEQLLGYCFKNKGLLIEAITHASCAFGSCMERLEFLGDAILDTIVVSVLWEKELSHRDMHLLRTALVNADLMGFLALEWKVSQEATEVRDRVVESTKIESPFWSFMQHYNSEIGVTQQAMKERHERERGPIVDAIHTSATYPWALLAHVNIPKFYSDLFESCLGAVWVDSGSIDVCQQVVERFGILPYLRRMLDENVDVVHPKNKLGEIVRDKKVRYENFTQEENLRCRVFVGDDFVVEVDGGVHKGEIQTKAAVAAYGILLARGSV